jgi:hypothetical protein
VAGRSAAIYVLEAAGEIRFDPIMAYDPRADVRAAARALLRLGARFGSSSPPGGAHAVLFIFSTHGGRSMPIRSQIPSK